MVWQSTTDTYTQTDSIYVSDWENMYRIMTRLSFLPNASTMLDKGRPLFIYAFKSGDASYMFPITIVRDELIRGLCPLNVEMNIVILWLMN